eukprot:366578-Chlamydomonas_euryale.AAC.8
MQGSVRPGLGWAAGMRAHPFWVCEVVTSHGAGMARCGLALAGKPARGPTKFGVCMGVISRWPAVACVAGMAPAAYAAVWHCGWYGTVASMGPAAVNGSYSAGCHPCTSDSLL